ncbi:MAG TPA: VWA domain-containing protein [Jatrophihabitans sp.]|nr:VWA domain-containing protein [Jatrophihabitans sp.]
MSRRSLRCRGLLAGLLGFGVLSAALAAPAAGAPTAAGTAAKGTAPVMVVLDASGSMNTADAPGPRIAAAKRAVRGLVDGVPAGAHVGLEVYGTSTGSSGAEKAAGCREIKVLMPVGPIDPIAFDARVDAIKASGYTPIGSALRRAAQSLPKEGARSIVLVSDGEDTCAPPKPCDVAKELKQQGVDLTVHTVGFKVNPAARAQLQCIAAATGGSYRDAADGPSLQKQLEVQVDRALRGYAAQGVPIAGGATAADPAPVTPGQYVDTFDRGAPRPSDDGTRKYYVVQLHTGDTPYFSATLIPPARRTSGSISFLAIDVVMRSLADDSCSVNGSYGIDSGVWGKVSASTSVVDPGQIGGADSSCLKAGPALVQVTRRGDAYVEDPLKVELAYRVEPPADAAGLPGPATEQAYPGVRVRGPATPIDSGSSYNDAPLLRTGLYRDSFVSGESRYVKVHLDWGQRLAYSFTFDKLPNRANAGGVGGWSALANPVREGVYQVKTITSDSAAFIGSQDASLSDATLVPVRYLNRESTDSGIHPYSIDGDYFLVLSTSFTNVGDPAITVPYTLGIQVIGAKERGPVYLADRATSQPSASATGAPTSAPTGIGSASSVAHSTASADSSVSTPVVVALIAAAALVCGGGAAWLTRRARH